MGQARPLALVVEDDPLERELASVVLEECEMDVVPCESAEAATAVLEALERQPLMLFADVRLPGVLTGADLAFLVRAKFPEARVIVTSGDDLPPPLPDGARFMPKPWVPLELVREATAVEMRARGGG
jgi:two-component system, cell cycle response regulator CpdR